MSDLTLQELKRQMAETLHHNIPANKWEDSRKGSGHSVGTCQKCGLTISLLEDAPRQAVYLTHTYREIGECDDCKGEAKNG
jgi:hypothetical protein